MLLNLQLSLIINNFLDEKLVAQTIQTNFEAITLTISELLAQLGEEGSGYYFLNIEKLF